MGKWGKMKHPDFYDTVMKGVLYFKENHHIEDQGDFLQQGPGSPGERDSVHH
jgi:hypothetical protein